MELLGWRHQLDPVALRHPLSLSVVMVGWAVQPCRPPASRDLLRCVVRLLHKVQVSLQAQITQPGYVAAPPTVVELLLAGDELQLSLRHVVLQVGLQLGDLRGIRLVQPDVPAREDLILRLLALVELGGLERPPLEPGLGVDVRWLDLGVAE